MRGTGACRVEWTMRLMIDALTARQKTAPDASSPMACIVWSRGGRWVKARTQAGAGVSSSGTMSRI